MREAAAARSRYFAKKSCEHNKHSSVPYLGEFLVEAGRSTLEEDIVMKARKYKTFNGLTGVLALFLAALVCVTSQQAMAQLPDVSDQYTIQVIEPPEGTTFVSFTLINEAGLVVMQYYPGAGQGNTAILENDKWTVINVPGAMWTGGSIPSASGRVGLTYADEDGFWHAAIYHRGTYQYLPDHPVYEYGINYISDHGLMSGVAFLPAEPDVWHGLLLNTSLSLFKVFDPPGSKCTLAFGINNAGLIVGIYFVGGYYVEPVHGFLYDGENFTDIDVPGAGATNIESINNSGEIVGNYVDSDGHWRGFLLRNGEFMDFSIPDSLWNSVDSINDRGQLSGSYVDADGNPRGYIATPVPGGIRGRK